MPLASYDPLSQAVHPRTCPALQTSLPRGATNLATATDFLATAGLPCLPMLSAAITIYSVVRTRPHLSSHMGIVVATVELVALVALLALAVGLGMAHSGLRASLVAILASAGTFWGQMMSWVSGAAASAGLAVLVAYMG